MADEFDYAGFVFRNLQSVREKVERDERRRPEVWQALRQEHDAWVDKAHDGRAKELCWWYSLVLVYAENLDVAVPKRHLPGYLHAALRRRLLEISWQEPGAKGKTGGQGKRGYRTPLNALIWELVAGGTDKPDDVIQALAGKEYDAVVKDVIWKNETDETVEWVDQKGRVKKTRFCTIRNEVAKAKKVLSKMT